MKTKTEITTDDIVNFAKKLEAFRATLNDKENTILTETLRLAGKPLLDAALSDVAGESTTKKKLNLVRETIQDLNVWELLDVTRGGELWNCPGLEAGVDVINPPPDLKKLEP
jgi:hypothetical protein